MGQSAQRAQGHSGIVNVVGDHAGYHLKHDAPLQSDLDGVVGSISNWVRRATHATMVGQLGAEAIQAARDGQIATLILQADAAWGDSVTGRRPRPGPPKTHAGRRAYCGGGQDPHLTGCCHPGGAALFGDGAEMAGKIAARTGCRLLAPFCAPRMGYGEGAVAFESLYYPADLNAAFLSEIGSITLVGESAPVNLFAYPGKPSTPDAPGCAIDRLCYGDWDVLGTLAALVEAVGVDGTEIVPRITRAVAEVENGPLTPEGMGRALAKAIPDGAIMVNEAVTASAGIFPPINTAAPHDRLNNTGGSIGQCLPNALGASVACPDRPFFAVSGDGSAMYQLQCLWTPAREELDITFVIVANRGYQILHLELAEQGAPKPGRNARAMFDIEAPLLDWVALAKGHGIGGVRVDTEEAFAEALEMARTTKGPFLIEAVI
ncbi:acetolactate synthase large subunit [Gymnodinialimonas ulvae]|uniref:acetolactate synthase large subunit n=1 Tax=Gymnodinialimonas ulvae TaxID=3126504 RepID=UPI0030A11BEE